MSQMNGPAGPPSGAAPTCASCGAPDAGDLVLCRFCRQAVSAEAARTAIPCPNPQCRTPCRWGKQKCPQCQAWLIVSCVFCGALSPHNLSSCMRCNEPFAGAAQRKALAQQHEEQQRNMQQVNAWGGVAASFLGAAAGVALGGSIGRAYDDVSSDDDSDASSVDTFDISGVSDDTGMDFGGDE